MGLYQSKQPRTDAKDRANAPDGNQLCSDHRRLSCSLSSSDRHSLLDMHLRKQRHLYRQDDEDEEMYQAPNNLDKRRWYVEDVTTASTEPMHPSPPNVNLNGHGGRYPLDSRREQYELLPQRHVDFQQGHFAAATTAADVAVQRRPLSSSCSSHLLSGSTRRNTRGDNSVYPNCHLVGAPARNSQRYVEFGHAPRERLSRQRQQKQRQPCYEIAASGDESCSTHVLCVNTPDSVAMFMEKFESDIKLLLPYCYRDGKAEASIALCFVSRLTVQDREASQKDSCKFFPRFQASQRDFYFRLIPVGAQSDGLFVVEYYNMPDYRHPTYVFDTHCWIEIEALLRLFFQQGYRYLMKLFPEYDLLEARTEKQSDLLLYQCCQKPDSADKCNSESDNQSSESESTVTGEGTTGCATCSRSWSTSMPLCAEENFLSMPKKHVFANSGGFF